MKASTQDSCELSRLGKSSQMPTKVSTWSSRLRAKDGSSNVSFGSAKSRKILANGKEKVNQPMADFDVSATHSTSNESLDEEFGIPKVKMPSVQRMEGETSLHKSTHVKYPKERLNYDSLQCIIMPTWLKWYRYKNPLVSNKQLLECLNGIKLWMRRRLHLISIKHGICHL